MNQQHSEKIKNMFSKVAHRYDLANTVLSAGIHHLWRKKLVQLSGAKKGHHILDCATGTGDLAIEFAKIVLPEGKVIGTDFCEEMLVTAPAKAQNRGFNIEFKTADVMNLGFSDNQFDISSISFGIRNVTDPLKGLSEMARVTKSGGKIMILEFGQMNIPGLAQAYSLYSEKVLPFIGGLVTGQKDAYEYLQKSSAQFPCRDEFLQLMKNTNSLSHVECHTLTGGIAYIYTGIKK